MVHRINLAYRTMSVSFYITLKCDLPAASILHVDLLRPMKPAYVRWWLKRSSNYASKYDCATSFHISIRIANQLGARNYQQEGEKKTNM
jgi:hypothetical protein